VKITAVNAETSRIRSFIFKDGRCQQAKAGQYIMVWVHGQDEVPMSLSLINDSGYSRITVDAVGDTSTALHDKKAGAILGIRGPFGNWFNPVEGRILVVGGGVGISPLVPLAKDLRERVQDAVFVLGARTETDLVFLEEIQSLIDERGQVSVTTEDGSLGVKGVVTDVIDQLYDEGGFDMIYTCGAEPMMRRVFDIAEAHNTPLQACMERLVRCSVGLCGSCMIGPYRVCQDGLVLTSDQLRSVLDEFGVYKRSFSGGKVYF
jgi:dihydroorotate dehydrogenase electron transfer subunit